MVIKHTELFLETLKLYNCIKKRRNILILWRHFWDKKFWSQLPPSYFFKKVVRRGRGEVDSNTADILKFSVRHSLKTRASLTNYGNAPQRKITTSNSSTCQIQLPKRKMTTLNSKSSSTPNILISVNKTFLLVFNRWCLSTVLSVKYQ